MARLTLKFVEDEKGVSLDEAWFLAPGLDERLLVRRGGNALPGVGNFKWSAAVHALSILCVRHSLSRYCEKLPESRSAYLSGEGGSAASSLDYALAKQPDWLLDLFGLNRDGSSITRKVFVRENPERRRPGPVRVGIRATFLPAEAIELFLGESQLLTVDTTEQLLCALEVQWDSVRSFGRRKRVTEFTEELLDIQSIEEEEKKAQEISSIEDLPTPFNKPFWARRLRKVFEKEVLNMLHETDIFSLRGYKKSIGKIYNNPSYVKTAGSRTEIVSRLDEKLRTSERLGLTDFIHARCVLDNNKPIRVALPPVLTGAYAIFSYLRMYRGFPFELHYQYPHTIEIVDRLLSGDMEDAPELCVVGVGPASRLLTSGKKVDYQPLMLLPQVTHKVLASANSNNRELNYGRYLFVTDSPSGASFYFEGLERYGILSKKKITIENYEPDQVTEILAEQDPDVRSILWFPHYEFNVMFNQCETVEEFDDKRAVSGESKKRLSDLALTHSVLFVHKSLADSDEKMIMLDVVVRDAWLTLRNGTSPFKNVIEEMISDSSYLSCLTRFGGLHSFRPEHFEEQQTSRQM